MFIHIAGALLLLTHRRRVPDKHRRASDLFGVFVLARRVAFEADADWRALDDELPVELHDIQSQIDAAAAGVKFARRACREHLARYFLTCGMVMSPGFWCHCLWTGKGGD